MPLAPPNVQPSFVACWQGLASTAQTATSLENMIEIALYQPDIAANTGTIARLCACLGLTLHIIEPAGFAWDDSKLRRAGMDYLDLACIRRHASWQHFQTATATQRKLLLTTTATQSYTSFTYCITDILLLGRESAGVPASVHDVADARLTIQMQVGARSLNVALAAAMVAGEAVRQTALAAIA
jgi:tRNA (cytidine/uridine-2'-O-)-methyltransferase